MSKKMVYLKILLDVISFIVCILVFIFLVPKALSFFSPIIIGYIISLFANPIVRFLEEKIRIVRKHGSALVIILVVGVIAIAIYGIMYLFWEQLNNIVKDLPQIYSRVEQQFNKIYNAMPQFMQRYVNEFYNKINSGSNTSIGDKYSSISFAKTTIVGFTNIMLSIIFAIMSAYYFTVERDKILCRFRLCLPGYLMGEIRKVFTKFKSIIGDYFKVQIKIMLMIIGILYIGFIVCNIEYALILAVIIGVMDFLPLLGVGTALIPWSIVCFLVGEYILGFELLIIYVICVIIREVAEPKMFSKSIGLSAFATFFLIYIGYKLGGVVGLVLAMPIGIILINLYKAGALNSIINDGKYVIRDIDRYRKRVNRYINEEEIKK